MTYTERPVYVVGQTVELYGKFAAGDPAVPTTPTTVRIGIVLPDDTLVEKVYPADPEVEEVEEGYVRWIYTLEDDGWYTWKVRGTGVAAAADQGQLEVKSNIFPF